MEKYKPRRAAKPGLRRASVKKKQPVKRKEVQTREQKPAATPEAKALSRRRGRIAGLCALLALALVYLLLCARVDPERAIFRSQVNGVTVEGMTRSEICVAVDDYCKETYSGHTLPVSANQETYQVSMGSSLSIDGDTAADALLSRSSGPFLTRGFFLLCNAVAGDNVIILPTVTNEAALEQAVEDSGLMEINTTVQTSYEVGKESIVFTMGKTGQSVDSDGLLKALKAAVVADDYESVITCPMLDGTVKPVKLKKLRKKIYQEPANATLDPEDNYSIVKSKQGIDFDVETAQKLLDAAGEGDTVEVELIREKPAVTTKVLKDGLFQDLLGTCTTNVSGTSNRLKNVQLAAEKINGTILLSGGEFSYNDTVGERTAANGFYTAGAYLNGETVQEYGGGICQVSSTAYLATVRANLEITERHNHTYVSSYMEPGMDATVSWGGPDFQFKNDRLCPIKIVTSYSSSNQITVSIMGTNVEGTYAELSNEILSWSDFGTVYKDDSSMYVGESRKSVSGEPGGKVQTYRTVYDKDGKEISKEKEAYSVYTKRDAVYYVGTKQKATETEPAADEDAAAAQTTE